MMNETTYITARPEEATVEGLWIDDPESLNKGLARVDPEIRHHVASFARNGYLVLPGLVPDNVIDQIVADAERWLSNPRAYVVRQGGQYVDVEHQGCLDEADRIIDLYGISEAARRAILHPTITKILNAIFGEPPIAMQSLSFVYGSQQGIHQDTAYVISQKPLHLAASWIALEDVKPGAGELVYYPGSHRFDHFLFGGTQKAWEKQKHGTQQHMAFLGQLHSQAADRNIPLEHFYAKKGDVFLWHADLAHGGAKRQIEDSTRKSLVAHYCPSNVKPKYYGVVGDEYFEYEVRHDKDNVGYFTSRHYRLADLANGPVASIYYDGGVSEQRKPLKQIKRKLWPF